jgi:mRNA-degrading endonuclease RelE of RelBE toxin-antitoxin system
LGEKNLYFNFVFSLKEHFFVKNIITMAISSNIEFSKGALMTLYMLPERKQTTILAAILKAVSFDVGTIPYRHRLQRVNGSELYMLHIDAKLRVIFKYVENKIQVADIMSADQINSFNKSVQTAT